MGSGFWDNHVYCILMLKIVERSLSWGIKAAALGGEEDKELWRKLQSRN